MKPLLPLLRRARGFTLVEVMIVVAIIALLAAIAIPNVLRGRTTANESASIGNIRALMSSLEMYRSVNNVYPASAAGAWEADMYTNATPDYGPPAFDDPMSAAVTITVGGYDYTFAGVAAGTTYNIDGVPETPLTTGTRRFRGSESGLVRHCNCPDTTCTNPSDAGWATEATISSTATSC